MTTLAELVVKIGLDSAQFEREISGMSGKLRSIGQDMTRIGGNLTRGLTLPIIGAGVAAFKMHKDFEFSMQSIVGLVGVSQSQVDQWSKDLVEMGPKLGKGPKELADALYFVTSAGIEASEALNVVEMSAKASAAGLGETKVIADLVTSAMNAYGAENLSASQATDILVAAVREGKAEASEFAGSLGKVLPIAAELGVEFHEVAAATAAMTRTGTDANTAGTQLRAIMSSLLKPTKQAEEVLDAMGTSSEKLRKKIRDDGLLSTLMELRNLTHEYGEEAMAAVFPNIRALIGMLDLMGANIEDNVKIFNNLTNATGALDHAFKTASETAEFKWQKVLASMQSLMITIGDSVKEAVIPVMEDLVKTIQKVTEWFKRLSPEAKTNIIRFAAYAAALGPILLIGGKLVGMFIGMVNTITVLSRALRLAVGFIKLKVAALVGMKAVMALMSGPAGWIMLAVAAIALIGTAWYKASRDSEKELNKLVATTKVKFMEIKTEAIQRAVEMAEGVIAEYYSLSELSRKLFKGMAETQAKIGKEAHEQIMANLESEKEGKLAFLKEQYDEELRQLAILHQNGFIATDEEYERLKIMVKGKYDDRVTMTEEMYKEIHRIVKRDLKEYGFLTEAGLKEIEDLYIDHAKEVIGTLEKFVVDNKALEALKNTDISNMTEAQLKEMKRLTEKYYGEAVTEIEGSIGEILTAINLLESTGAISAGEAAVLYQKAMGKMIDANVDVAKSATDMVNDIDRELDRLRREGIMKQETFGEDTVDIWENLNKLLVGSSIVPDMVTDILKWFDTLKKEGGKIVVDMVRDIQGSFNRLWDYIRQIPSQAFRWGRDIFFQLWQGMRSIFSSIQSWFSTQVTPLLNRLNPWARMSPSLIDNIRSGIKEIEKAYTSIQLPDYGAVKGLGIVSFPDNQAQEVLPPQSDNRNSASLNRSGQPPFELGGKLAMIIADDRVLKQLWRQLQDAGRAEGVRISG